MNITDVRVRKVTKEGKMKAVVSITIDDEFPGAFLSVKTKMTIYKSISPSFYEGGDSEWFINYPSFIIKGICEQSVSKF